MRRLKKVFEQSPITLLIALICAVGLLILLRQFLPISRRKEKPSKQIFRILKKQGLEPAMSRLLVAQAIHETGNFNSRLFLQENNAFGMKVPSIRKTLNVNPKQGQFSTFLSVEDSVKDMLLYLDHFNIPLNVENPFIYAKILKSKNYFEDDTEIYFKGLVNGLQLIK